MGDKGNCVGGLGQTQVNEATRCHLMIRDSSPKTRDTKSKAISKVNVIPISHCKPLNRITAYHGGSSLT